MNRFWILLTVCVSIASADLFGQRFAVDRKIRENRMGTLIIKAEPGSRVTVHQTRHEFWFGAALSNRAFSGRMEEADAARYRAVFLENFNSAVTENALKWLITEREQGEIDFSVVDAILEWTDANDVPLRGHNIFWGVPKWTQDWVKNLDDAALLAAVEKRARDVARRYRGRFAEYDLNNEMIHGNVFEERLGEDITLRMAQWVKEEDPEAILFLNDYEVLTGEKVRAYSRDIKRLLKMGVPIGGIGVQGHSHDQQFSSRELKGALNDLSDFGLPIRITEFNMSGQNSKFYENRSMEITDIEEEEKAANLEEYFRICFSHPAVKGILLWGFWEGANWIPQSSLFKRDWTLTPAGETYRRLVFEEWWTNETATVGDSGRVEIEAFFGRHDVTVGDTTIPVELRSDQGTGMVAFQ